MCKLLTCLICSLLLFLSSTMYSQSVDTAILGTATDPSGAVVAGATVKVTSVTTGITKVGTTGSEGQYAIRYLTPGKYDVEITAPGFSSAERKGVDLALAQQAKVDFKVTIGSSTQVVEVESTMPLLQSESAALGATVDTDRTVNLPLNGRKFNDLAVLTPGVTVSNPDNHSSSTAGSAVGANGGRNRWGQIDVDGITMLNNRQAYVNSYPSVDAIQEFRVQTGNYSAQYGFSAGTNITVQLKSGGNKFHGTVFEFIRNNAVDARNYFRNAPLPKNILKQNQFGATIGGPIFRDKTFFFFSYEGLRSLQEVPSTANVLTQAQRNGDFSALLALPTPIRLRNPFGGFYAGNIIPVNSVSQALINQYVPLPNSTGTQNYSGASIGNEKVDQEIGRLDHRFNDKNSIFIHYIHTYRDFPNANVNRNFTFTGKYPMHNAAFQFLHIFTPNLVNELRMGANLEHVSQLSTRTNTNFTIASLGITGFKVGGPSGRDLTSSEQGFPLLNITGFLGMGDDKAASNLDYSRTFQLADNITWTRGRHTLLFGGDIRKALDNATTNNTPFGSETFTGDITGYAAADYMLGYPKTSITPEGVPITAARQWRTAEYFQDNWRATDKLTLNLGVRYEIYAPPYDTNNVSRTLDFSTATPTLTPAPGQRLDGIWKITYKDIAPRLGFAYSISPKTVLRGGYGMTYFGGQFDNINILQLNPPTAGSLTITNPSTNPVATISTPVPASLYPNPPFFNVTSVPADRKRPDVNVQTYNLTVSQQFGKSVLDVSYVGVKGTHLDTSLTYFNSPQPGGTGAVQARRPYPTFARIRALDFTGASNYNALQVHFEHRMTSQLNVTVVYAYSHQLDNQGADVNSGGCTCQNIRAPHEYASGTTDQRHNLVIGYVWHMPKFTQNRAFGTAVNGWSLNGLILLNSGTPLNVTQSTDGQNVDNPWQRPNQTGLNPYLANPTPTLRLSSAAYSLSTATFGTTPRNSLLGTSTKVVNAAVMKDFAMPFNENHKLQARFEAFNALNTPQFSNPGTSWGASSFGQISSTKINNRELQAALKYIF